MIVRSAVKQGARADVGGRKPGRTRASTLLVSGILFCIAALAGILATLLVPAAEKRPAVKAPAETYVIQDSRIVYEDSDVVIFTPDPDGR